MNFWIGVCILTEKNSVFGLRTMNTDPIYISKLKIKCSDFQKGEKLACNFSMKSKRHSEQRPNKDIFTCVICYSWICLVLKIKQVKREMAPGEAECWRNVKLIYFCFSSLPCLHIQKPFQQSTLYQSDFLPEQGWFTWWFFKHD